MKNNHNNILKFGYYKLFRLSNIKQFFRNMKFAYQRITKGYCEPDVWDMDVYLQYLLPDMLRELAETTHGWPQSKEFPNFEDWQEYLREIALHFENSREDNSTEIEREEDEAFEKILKYREGLSLEESIDFKSNPEYQKLQKDWLELTKQVSQMREREKNKAFDKMRNHFFSLWD